MKSSFYMMLGAMVAQLAIGSLAHAAVTDKDVKLLARLIGMVENGPKGQVPVAIVTGDGAAQADVDGFRSLIGSGKTIGNVTLTASAMPVSELNSTNAKVVLIPEGTSAAQLAQIFAIAKNRKLITVSTSKACLATQQCAVAIKSEPTVDIQVSASAAAATNVYFGSVVRLMIKEVP